MMGRICGSGVLVSPWLQVLFSKSLDKKDKSRNGWSEFMIQARKYEFIFSE